MRRYPSRIACDRIERRVTIAFVVTSDAVLVEGIFYGGQDFEAALCDRP